MKTSPIFRTGLAWHVTFLMVACISRTFAAETKTAAPPPAKVYEPRLIRTIQFGDYRSAFVRLGDLDNDGQPEILLTQAVAHDNDQEKVQITCLTALDLQGRILWQWGKPNPTNTYFGCELASQIYDQDGDGTNEVFFIEDTRYILTILNGQTGKVKRQVPLQGGLNALLFADLEGRGRPENLVVKNVYTSFWTYDRDFRFMWGRTNDANTGHYPMNYDLDGDGKDELLSGYTLYNGKGRQLWQQRELPLHNDATDIDDMDGDGQPEIAIATSRDAVLLNAAGKILFRKKMGHCQHTLIGKFRADLPGKQVAYLDRYDVYKTNKDERRSGISMFTMSGERIWKTTGDIWVAGIMKVDNWTGNPDENFVCAYSRGFEPATLLDGYGREVARFPLPAAIVKPGGGPDGKDVYEDYFVQHIDCHGDEREEILVFNTKELRIYTNPTLWQKQRLFNGTYYPGRL